MTYRICLILGFLTLTACVGATPMPIDNKKYLEESEGPKVDGVNDTLEKNADRAMENGNYPQAVQNYQQLVDNAHENMSYKLKLADARRRAGDVDTAVGLYDAVLKKEPGNLDAQEGKALGLMFQGEFDTSAGMLSDIMKADPKRWRTLNALALMFVRRNMPDEAMSYFAEALKYSKNNASVLNNVGLTHAINGDSDKAIEALEQASRLAPNKSALKMQIDMNLALVYGVSGNMDRAEDVAGQYLHGPALDNNLGLYAYLAKDEKLAKSYFNMALTSSPYYYPRAWDNLTKIDSTTKSMKPPALGGKRIKVN
ncbi:MAG: tetratricopeptide repeat protein [Rickettsiales bacterium]